MNATDPHVRAATSPGLTPTFINRFCLHARARAVRRELQDVRPISMGFMGGEIGKKNPPMLRLERGAMIHFGVPSFGIHVNGYTVDPTTMRPKAIWIAKRSMSKATYPGMFDQVDPSTPTTKPQLTP